MQLQKLIKLIKLKRNRELSDLDLEIKLRLSLVTLLLIALLHRTSSAKMQEAACLSFFSKEDLFFTGSGVSQNFFSRVLGYKLRSLLLLLNKNFLYI